MFVEWLEFSRGPARHGTPEDRAPITLSSTTTTTTAKPKVIGLEHEFYDGCTTDKVCFGVPQGCVTTGTCHTVVSYELSNDKYLFKMIGYPVGGAGGYIALGLSPGDTQVWSL